MRDSLCRPLKGTGVSIFNGLSLRATSCLLLVHLLYQTLHQAALWGLFPELNLPVCLFGQGRKARRWPGPFMYLATNSS